MSFLKSIWERVSETVEGLNMKYGAPEIPGVPTAKDFAEMQSVEEAVYPIPETAPVVATGARITVGKPLQLKTSKTQPTA
jgi:hypothetical protein